MAVFSDGKFLPIAFRPNVLSYSRATQRTGLRRQGLLTPAGIP